MKKQKALKPTNEQIIFDINSVTESYVTRRYDNRIKC